MASAQQVNDVNGCHPFWLFRVKNVCFAKNGCFAPFRGESCISLKKSS